MSDLKPYYIQLPKNLKPADFESLLSEALGKKKFELLPSKKGNVPVMIIKPQANQFDSALSKFEQTAKKMETVKKPSRKGVKITISDVGDSIHDAMNEP